MPERKSTNSTIALRRSPRFRHEDPKTPEPKKTLPIRVTSTPLNSSPPKFPNKFVQNPTTAARPGVSVNSRKRQSESDRNDPHFCVVEKRATRSLAKSKSVNNQVEVCNLEEGSCGKVRNLSKKERKGKAVVVSDGNTEKRASSSSARRSTEKSVSRISEERKLNRVAKGKAVVVGDGVQCVGNTEKRASSSSARRRTEKSVSRISEERKLNLVAKGRKKDAELAKPRVKKRDDKECGPETTGGNRECEGKMLIGEKRKRSGVDKKSKIVLGWTEEQETALGRAYFTARPTPQFWKKVARMVPGKSAQDCFDRIHSDHQTPPQPCTRSMSRIKPSSPTFSASKLLDAANTKTKKLRSTKRNCLLAHKTVRQLLQKQQNEDKDHGVDLFSELEPTVNLSSLSFANPYLSRSPASSPMVLSRSLSAHRLPLSPLSGSNSAVLVSPPVLKQVKNKALHEKYIDHLLHRDAKRKAQSLRNSRSKLATNGEMARTSEVNPVKSAKDALMVVAQDALAQFQKAQSSMIIDELFNLEDNSYQSNED